MNENITPKPASQDEIALYCFIGEALCKTQEVEQALCHSITLKMNSTLTREKADEILYKQLSNTLGNAIVLAKRKKLYPASFQKDLGNFLERRNWLVHKVMCERRDDPNSELNKEKLLAKLKSISDDAENIQRTIEKDMIDFCISKGRDMSKVIAMINEADNASTNTSSL